MSEEKKEFLYKLVRACTGVQYYIMVIA